ncbi:hypothetical protein BDM02DRAFT_3245230 [Thelephora ganbajun]|uniref:Uncharacterized protein n=1 Tax=Thelephora ganbajun TaxID=370292 RepID=A0ACB6YXK6_THEGA|nr:hypothetical protein BDM02DRAFT_3245230 [Thelephora ganbajun]
MRREGLPIEGFCVAADIPTAEKAAEIIEGLSPRLVLAAFPLSLVRWTAFVSSSNHWSYLIGDWSMEYGVQSMLFDDFPFASRVTIAMEAHTSIKDLIVAAPGVADAHREAPMTKRLTAAHGVKLWKEFDNTIFTMPKERRAAWLAEHRVEIIYNKFNQNFQKPWFGWKKDGTAVEHPSDMTCEETVLQTSFTSLDQPHAFIEDKVYFLMITQHHSRKPVLFIPTLNAPSEVWLKKDSLRQTEDIDTVFDRDPQRICIPQGPVAVVHPKVKDELIKDMPGNIMKDLIKKLPDQYHDGDALTVPMIDYLVPPPTLPAIPVKSIKAKGSLVFHLLSAPFRFTESQMVTTYALRASTGVSAISPQSTDGNLLNLVHLSNGFHMSDGASPLHVGDVVTNEVKVTFVISTDTGKAVKATGYIVHERKPVTEATSSFLYHGQFTDYKNTFEIVQEPDHAEDCHRDPVVAHVQRHGTTEGTATYLPNDGYTMTGSTTTTFTTLFSNQRCMNIPKDFNPIRVNPYFSNFVSLPGTITHGVMFHLSICVTVRVGTYNDDDMRVLKGPAEVDQPLLLMSSLAMVHGNLVWEWSSTMTLPPPVPFGMLPTSIFSPFTDPPSSRLLPYVHKSLTPHDILYSIATWAYATASMAGSITFGLNFGEEVGATMKVWLLHACIIQGSQQIWVAALWCWGDYHHQTSLKVPNFCNRLFRFSNYLFPSLMGGNGPSCETLRSRIGKSSSLLLSSPPFGRPYSRSSPGLARFIHGSLPSSRLARVLHMLWDVSSIALYVPWVGGAGPWMLGSVVVIVVGLTMDNGSIHIDTPFSQLTGKPPIMVTGMTPSTIKSGLRDEGRSAKWDRWLVEGSKQDQDILILERGVYKKRRNDSVGITMNSLHINPRRFTFQLSLWQEMCCKGLLVEGLCVAAGNPMKEKAAEIIKGLTKVCIKHVSLKPGSVGNIRQVVNITAPNCHP